MRTSSHDQNISVIYRRGLELYQKEGNHSDALVYLKRAAKEGYAKAFCEVGIILARELRQADEAERWLKKAAELHALSSEAAHEYGMLLYFTKNDIGNCLKYLYRAANAQYGLAYGDLGSVLYVAKGEIAEAEKWFEKAIRVDCLLAPAAYHYAMLLLFEKEDDEAAFQNFLKAAKEKFEMAYVELGSLYYFYKNDVDEAEKWFQKAEEANCLLAPAAYDYGMLLLDARGEEEKGLHYLQKAKDDGYE